MIYLGIEINSEAQTIALPQEKIDTLTTILPSWLTCKKCTQKELLSLIGKLAFAGKVIRPGRIFLHSLISTSYSVKRLHHFIYLNKEAQKDIKWWIDNFTHLNKKHYIPGNFSLTTNDIKLFTDASLIGFGPYMTTLGFRKNGHYHLYTIQLIIKNYLQSGHPVSLGAHTGRGNE